MDGWVDSHQTFNSQGGVVTYWPLENTTNKSTNLVKYDGNVNDPGDFGFSPIVSQITASITGPKILGNATPLAFFQKDFYGSNNLTVGGLRMMSIYLSLDWKDAFKILLGQAWHPFCRENIWPNTVGWASGAPMYPWCRVPQIRTEITLGKIFVIEGTLYSQSDTTDTGFSGSDPRVFLNAQRPGFNLLFHADFPNTTNPLVIIGMGMDNREIVPRLQSDYIKNGTIHIEPDDNSLNSWIFSIFGRIKTNRLTIRTQYTSGENGYMFSMLGGYVVSTKTDTNHQQYTNIKFWALSTDVELNASRYIVPGIFYGYTKRLGIENNTLFIEPTTGINFFGGFDARIKSVYRIAPRLWLFDGSKKFQVGLEIEFDKAMFEALDPQNTTQPHSSASNVRATGVVQYNF
jgi:hypothetical protein